MVEEREGNEDGMERKEEKKMSFQTLSRIEEKEEKEDEFWGFDSSVELNLLNTEKHQSSSNLESMHMQIL